jgi:hypothetical protein
LARVAALHPLSAALTPPHVNVKLDLLHAGFRYFGLILVLDPGLNQLTPAVRAASRQFCFHGLVDDCRNRAATTATIFSPRFPPGFGGMGFRCSPRKRRGLTFPRALGLFQGPHQLFHPSSQALVLCLQFCVLALQASDSFFNRLHAVSLTALCLAATTF